MTAEFGTTYITCPACEENIAVPVTGKLITDEAGQQCLNTIPDVADLWAHTWTHTEGAA